MPKLTDDTPTNLTKSPDAEVADKANDRPVEHVEYPDATAGTPITAEPADQTPMLKPITDAPAFAGPHNDDVPTPAEQAADTQNPDPLRGVEIDGPAPVLGAPIGVNPIVPQATVVLDPAVVARQAFQGYADVDPALTEDHALIPMHHPDGGASEAFEADADGNILVPAREVEALRAHGFVVAIDADHRVEADDGDGALDEPAEPDPVRLTPAEKVSELVDGHTKAELLDKAAGLEVRASDAKPVIAEAIVNAGIVPLVAGETETTGLDPVTGAKVPVAFAEAPEVRRFTAPPHVTNVMLHAGVFTVEDGYIVTPDDLTPGDLHGLSAAGFEPVVLDALDRVSALMDEHTKAELLDKAAGLDVSSGATKLAIAEAIVAGPPVAETDPAEPQGLIAMADLTTLAAVKAYASVDTAVDDAMLQALVTGYSDIIRVYTGRDFVLSSYGAYFDGRNSARLVLPQTPVVSVTDVIIDGAPVLPQTVQGGPGYRFDATSVILDGYRFSRGWGNIRIDWTAGYASVPAAITQAANEMIALRYALRSTMGIASKSLAGETISFSQRDMPASAKTVLDQFKAVV